MQLQRKIALYEGVGAHNQNVTTTVQKLKCECKAKTLVQCLCARSVPEFSFSISSGIQNVRLCMQYFPMKNS